MEKTYTLTLENNYHTSSFIDGFLTALPIGLIYFCAGFPTGIAASTSGLNIMQGAFSSFITNTASTQIMVYQQIADNATWLEILILSFVASARYMLMSCLLAQKLPANAGFKEKLLLGLDFTDEIFGILITRKGKIELPFFFGMVSATAPFFTLGTALGSYGGELFSAKVINALCVTLYSMFLAIIIPQAKYNRSVATVISVSFLMSIICSMLPYVKEITYSNRIIILTIIISSLAAYITTKYSRVNF